MTASSTAEPPSRRRTCGKSSRGGSALLSIVVAIAVVSCLLHSIIAPIFFVAIPRSSHRAGAKVDRTGLQPRGRVLCRATATTTSSSTATDGECLIAGREPQELAKDAQKLLQDIAEITLNTGFQTGFARATQAARAAALTAADIAREPPSELNEAFLARVLRQLFERLGATYIKLGQFIASSPTIFPAAFVREFQKCLDSTGTIPYDEVRRVIEDDLGAPLSSVYSFFDPEPMASASIAQVHAATLKSGEDVVVKVQKPDIKETLETDLGFIYISARVLEFINPLLNSRASIADVASDLRTSMLGELDFREEQRNLEIFRTFLSDNNLDKVALAPKPYPTASSRRVLTMERLYGVPLVDLEGIRKFSKDPEATLVAALNVWAVSVQSCEFFHADVHAGNLLVVEDGRVGFLDFGIVGRLPPKMSEAIDNLNDALAVGNATGMARALISMGATTGEVNEDAFAADIGDLLERLGSVAVDGAEGANAAGGATVDESQIQDIVLDIAQVAGNNGLKLPREFGLLIKQALYFDRYTKLLAPDLNMASDPRIARLGGAGTSGGGDAVAVAGGAAVSKQEEEEAAAATLLEVEVLPPTTPPTTTG